MQDILQLAKNSRDYSSLLNNYTLPVNASFPWPDNGSSNLHNQYEGAVVYAKTELVITNLRHFQEYSIEVSWHSRACVTELLSSLFGDHKVADRPAITF